MSDETVAQFAAVTGASPDKAQQYLNISDGNIEQAIQLWYETGGINLMEATTGAAPASSNRPPVPHETRPRPQPEVVEIESDDDEMPDNDSDADFAALSRNTNEPSSLRAAPPGTEDDEAMARRLQEEMYGATNGPGLDGDGVRAPIARTTETLVGPEPYDLTNPGDRAAAVAEQLLRRSQAAAGMGDASYPDSTLTTAHTAGRSRGAPSIWDQNEDYSQRMRLQAEQSAALAASSSSSSKTTRLAEMFRPPFDLMSRLSWDEAREEGKEDQRWILVNVQDPSIFDCQVLNRDIWKHEGIRETVQENFIFLQYSKDDRRGEQYMQYYFQNRDVESAYPHIAVVDPRTGEQVKVWSGAPAPKPMDFLMQLHEFLDRYSLSASAKNPVARRKPEPKKEAQVERMTEEEQLQMAMQASLAAAHPGPAGSSNDADPDALTRSISDLRKPPPPAAAAAAAAAADDATMTDPDAATDANDSGAAPPVTAAASVFAGIPSDRPHAEPATTAPDTTRIQFRHPDGRVVRRFGLAEPVQRLYEWLKAEPLAGTAGREFGLVFMGRNLVADVEAGRSVGEAGLRNGSVNVEFVEE